MLIFRGSKPIPTPGCGDFQFLRPRNRGLETPGVHDKKVTTGSRSGFGIGSPFPKVFKAPAESNAAERHNGIGSPHAPMHPGPFESCSDGVLASGFHHAGGGAESLGLELGVAHAMSMLSEIGPGRFSLLVMGGLGGEDRKQGLDPAGIEFPTTLLGPLLP